MKVVILANDRGIRLREDTEYRPKALAPIGGSPLVWHIMNLYSYYGFNEFILCVGVGGYRIKDYFLNYRIFAENFTLELGTPSDLHFHGSNKRRNWRITFLDVGSLTMTGSSLALVKPFIDEAHSFFLTYCDTLSNVNISELSKFHEAMGRVVTMTGAHPVSPLGVVEAEDGLAKSFKEKPRLEGLVKGGFFVCDYRVFNYLTLAGDFMFEDESLQKLIKDYELALFEHKDFWYRVDTYKDIEALEEMWKSDRASWKVWQD